MALHLYQPKIQYIDLLGFVSDEYLCCCSVHIRTINAQFTFLRDFTVTFVLLAVAFLVDVFGAEMRLVY
jgi:hypothetical protein